MAAKPKCECKPIHGIIGVILMALGIYFLVWGFMTQTTSVISWSVWNFSACLLYLIGIIVFKVGIILKNKCYLNCKLHSC